MTSKVAKALAYNPAAFNQVAFAMNAVGGRKSPSEKEALESKYYQHLKNPGFLRVQFFRDHPLYVNLTNMIPYYSLNQFAPSERSFKSTWANGIAQAVDSSPFFKGPWGQTLIDYLVLPSFLDDAEVPQGYFGQAVWPSDASGIEKAGYAARGIGEAFTPGILGLAGVAGGPIPALADPAIVEKLPLSKLRTMLYATQGKSSIGAQTNETPWQKVQRALASQAGVPVTPVKTEYSPKK